MIKSMTAFSRQQHQDAECQIQWEIRSVNHRYLDVSFRLPDALRDLEPALRDLSKDYLSRGKVECSLRYAPGAEMVPEMMLNQNLLDSLQKITGEVKNKMPEWRLGGVMDMLRWPGVLQTAENDLTNVKKTALALFEVALKEFVESRAREGEKLKVLLLERTKFVAEEIKKVRAVLPDILKVQREKLLARFEEAKIELDQDRLEQEILMLAQKMDVVEELDRLEAHVSEMEMTLKKGGAVGRRLDFLLQEFNREANTLGSKSVNSVTSKASIELKVGIEQMREQVQNIE